MNHVNLEPAAEQQDLLILGYYLIIILNISNWAYNGSVKSN